VLKLDVRPTVTERRPNKVQVVVTDPVEARGDELLGS